MQPASRPARQIRVARREIMVATPFRYGCRLPAPSAFGVQLAHGNVAFAASGAVLDLSDQLAAGSVDVVAPGGAHGDVVAGLLQKILETADGVVARPLISGMREGVEGNQGDRSEEHTSELQSREKLVCRLLLE